MGETILRGGGSRKWDSVRSGRRSWQAEYLGSESGSDTDSGKLPRLGQPPSCRSGRCSCEIIYIARRSTKQFSSRRGPDQSSRQLGSSNKRCPRTVSSKGAIAGSTPLLVCISCQPIRGAESRASSLDSLTSGVLTNEGGSPREFGSSVDGRISTTPSYP